MGLHQHNSQQAKHSPQREYVAGQTENKWLAVSGTSWQNGQCAWSEVIMFSFNNLSSVFNFSFSTNQARISALGKASPFQTVKVEVAWEGGGVESLL